MKSMSATEVRSNLESVLRSAQKERILVTRGGKPSAIIIGVESYDQEDLDLARYKSFWRMIESRRHSGKSMPLAEVKARLKSRERAAKARKR